MKWVKHDTDANQDAKLQNVLLDYGLEGYGLYWYCIELIAGKIDKENITFELEHDARVIARNTGCTAQKVEEMMKYFVASGLFENSNGVVTCLKLAKRLDKSMTSNPEMRSIIAQLKNHDPIMTQSAKPMQDKTRLDKTRLDKNKDITPVANAPVKQKRFIPPVVQTVSQYMVERGVTFNDSITEGEKFVDFYESKGWMVGKNKMKSWQAAVRNWLKNYKPPQSFDDINNDTSWIEVMDL